MTSKAFSQGGFLYPNTSKDQVVEEKPVSMSNRNATVYDAVAGTLL